MPFGAKASFGERLRVSSRAVRTSHPPLPRTRSWLRWSRSGGTEANGAMSECIPWWGAVHEQGYGRIGGRHDRRFAHRMIWEECFGPLPEGAIIHHTCENRLCVNPEHMQPVTRIEHNTIHG